MLQLYLCFFSRDFVIQLFPYMRAIDKREIDRMPGIIKHARNSVDDIYLGYCNLFSFLRTSRKTLQKKLWQKTKEVFDFSFNWRKNCVSYTKWAMSKYIILVNFVQMKLCAGSNAGPFSDFTIQRTKICSMPDAPRCLTWEANLTLFITHCFTFSISFSSISNHKRKNGYFIGTLWFVQ